jgi:hypothetical protein
MPKSESEFMSFCAEHYILQGDGLIVQYAEEEEAMVLGLIRKGWLRGDGSGWGNRRHVRVTELGTQFFLQR